MGALDYLSNFCTATSTRRKPMQTGEIKVKMDCDGCERRVKNSVKSMQGVKSVEINRKQSRVTVNGNVDPNKVLKNVINTGKEKNSGPTCRRFYSEKEQIVRYGDCKMRFYGPPGTGKTTTALAITHHLFCGPPGTGKNILGFSLAHLIRLSSLMRQIQR